MPKAATTRRPTTAHRSEAAVQVTAPTDKVERQGPVLIPPLPKHVARLGPSSQRAIASMEEQLDGKVVACWMSTHAELDRETPEILRRVVLGWQEKTIHLCLTSMGGSAEAALVTAEILRSACKRLIVHVPVHACSAATMLALAGNEIRLASGAYLTAVDATFGGYGGPPINELELARLRAPAPPRRPHRQGTADGYEHLFDKIPPLGIAHMLRGSNRTELICQRILRHHMPNASRRSKVIDALLRGLPDHSYPVCLDEARSLGLPVVPLTGPAYAAMLGLHDLHVSFGRMHRVLTAPQTRRETTMRTIIGTAQQTVAMVADYEKVRVEGEESSRELWRNNGWRRIEGACPRMPVELCPGT